MKEGEKGRTYIHSWFCQTKLFWVCRCSWPNWPIWLIAFPLY